jgi:hypothetical protein
MSLIAEGFHHHVPKGYVYFAMGFSVFVEMLNLRLRKHVDDDVEPVQLRGSYMHPDAGDDDGPRQGLSAEDDDAARAWDRRGVGEVNQNERGGGEPSPRGLQLQEGTEASQEKVSPAVLSL